MLIVNSSSPRTCTPAIELSGDRLMSRVAVVQAASVPFDAAATVLKAEGLIAECAERGAELALFPEAFVGGYPKGTGFGAVVGRRTGPGRELYRRYFEAAVELEGPEVAGLVRAAAASGVFVVVGIIERLGATLYCTALMIDPKAGLVGIHRKLMPTGTERLIWGFGDGSTIGTVATPVGTRRRGDLLGELHAGAAAGDVRAGQSSSTARRPPTTVQRGSRR